MWIGMRTSARMWRSTSRRAHYVREHGVWLPARFVEHVRAMRIQLEEMPWTTLGGAAKHPGTEQSTPCQAKRPAGDCAGPFRCRLGSGCAGFGGVVGRVLVGEGLDGFAADRAAELAVADLGRLGLLLGGAVGRRAPVRERDVLAGRPGVAVVRVERRDDDLALRGRRQLALGDPLQQPELLLVVADRVVVPDDRVAVLEVVHQRADRRAVRRVVLLVERRRVLVVLAGRRRGVLVLDHDPLLGLVLLVRLRRVAGYAMMPSPTTIASTTIRIVRRLSALAWSRCIFSISSRRDCF